ncbi:hypothetical protein BM1_02382 [Bipolaris maydis]|nr:hypothetical protein BM1_02382 [Bipolaris maydis]
MVQATPAAPPEDVAHDHLCPICQLLLYTPVRTQCNHLLCTSCMAQWADASSTNQIEHSSLDVHLADFDPNYDPSYDLEANCPMCRTHTTASPDKRLARQLEAQYPVTYAERRVEEEVDRGSRIGQDGVEGVMILIGNKHRLIRNPGSANEHLWTFFHPTFRPSHHVLRTAPYEFEAQGWGFFTIKSKIVLKAPYNWIIDNSGTKKQGLELSWTLDFEGRGRQGRVRAKVKKFEAETAPTGRTLRSRHIPATTEPEADNENEDGDEDSSEDGVEDEGDSEFVVPSRRSRR